MHRSHRKRAKLFGGLRAISSYELMKRAQHGGAILEHRATMFCKGANQACSGSRRMESGRTGKKNPSFGSRAAYNGAGAVQRASADPDLDREDEKTSARGEP